MAEPIKSIKTTWNKLRDQAGLDKNVVPYTIRHTVATELRSRSVPEWECSGFMGQRSGRVTERYAKFRPDHLGAAVKAIDAYCADLSAVANTPIVLDVVPFTRPLRAHHGQGNA